MARKPKPEKSKPAPRRAAAGATAEVVEEVEGGGLTLDDGIVLSTTVALAGALTLMILAYQIYKV